MAGNDKRVQNYLKNRTEPRRGPVKIGGARNLAVEERGSDGVGC